MFSRKSSSDVCFLNFAAKLSDSVLGQFVNKVFFKYADKNKDGVISKDELFNAVEGVYK
jgi:hypothetical protein